VKLPANPEAVEGAVRLSGRTSLRLESPRQRPLTWLMPMISRSIAAPERMTEATVVWEMKETPRYREEYAQPYRKYWGFKIGFLVVRDGLGFGRGAKTEDDRRRITRQLGGSGRNFRPK